MKQYELEQRLIRFSNSIIEMVKMMDNGFSAQHLARQIIRSSTSCALNYGEAQGAPTKKDFINKTSIVLKELRETSVNLQLIEESKLINNSEIIGNIQDENRQLIAIFTKTVQTAKANEQKERK